MWNNLKHTFLLMLSSLVLTSGCRQSEKMPQSVANDISEAICRISYRGIHIGLGTFVGSIIDGEEKIFFLTARHVITFNQCFRDTLVLNVGYGDNRKSWKLTPREKSWISSERCYDYAWFEVTNGDKKNMVQSGIHLKYIPIRGKDFKSESESLENLVSDVFGDMLASLQAKVVRGPINVAMFFDDKICYGNTRLDSLSEIGLPFINNLNLKSCVMELLIVSELGQSVKRGDSGCPAFIKTGKSYAMAGIIVGGNDNLQAGLLPLDGFINRYRFKELPLIEFPEYW